MARFGKHYNGKTIKYNEYGTLNARKEALLAFMDEARKRNMTATQAIEYATELLRSNTNIPQDAFNKLQELSYTSSKLAKKIKELENGHGFFG